MSNGLETRLSRLEQRVADRRQPLANHDCRRLEELEEELRVIYNLPKKHQPDGIARDEDRTSPAVRLVNAMRVLYNLEPKTDKVARDEDRPSPPIAH